MLGEPRRRQRIEPSEPGRMKECVRCRLTALSLNTRLNSGNRRSSGSCCYSGRVNCPVSAIQRTPLLSLPAQRSMIPGSLTQTTAAIFHSAVPGCGALHGPSASHQPPLAVWHAARSLFALPLPSRNMLPLRSTYSCSRPSPSPQQLHQRPIEYLIPNTVAPACPGAA